MSMKYYFYELEDSTIVSLERTDFEANPIVLERWDVESGKWVFSPETIAITGLGGDGHSYREITEIVKTSPYFREVRKKEESPTGSQ